MKEKVNGAWLTLNTSYYVAAIGNPLTLLDDSYMLLERAHGVVQLMREALQLSPCIDARADACAKRRRNTDANERRLCGRGSCTPRADWRWLDCRQLKQRCANGQMKESRALLMNVVIDASIRSDGVYARKANTGQNEDDEVDPQNPMKNPRP
jgi:hypothetical protein